MGKKKSLRIGVIGAGLMGGEHIKGIRQIIGRGLLPVSIGAIASLNHGKGRPISRELGCEYYEGGDKLIEESDVDVVVIATPTDQHLPLVKKAAKAGKAIFLEKPIGRNLSEALKIRDALQASGAPHQIGLVLRFSPTYNVLKQSLGDPKNGEFIFCRFRDDQFFPVRSVYDSAWRADVKQAGGGALIEHSIHDIDVLHWFFGVPKQLEHSGVLTLPSKARGIEKLAAIQMIFPNGGRGQLSSIWHHNLGRENERHIEIFFENRFFHTLGGFTSPILVQGPKGGGNVIGTQEIERRYRRMIGWKDAKNADFPSTLGYEMYVFLKNVLEGRKPSAVDVSIGIEAHTTIELAYSIARKLGRKR